MRGDGRHFSPALDEITKRIIDMMVAGEWIIGKSHRQLAEEYPDRSVDQLRKHASDASRFIRLCHGDSDEVRDRILLGIERGIRLAVDAEKSIYDIEDKVWVSRKQPDLRALKDFLQLQAEVHGLLVRDAKRQSTDTVDVPVDELNRVLGASGYEVRRKEDDGSSSEGSTAAIE